MKRTVAVFTSLLILLIIGITTAGSDSSSGSSRAHAAALPNRSAPEAAPSPAAPLSYDPRVSLAPLVKQLGPTVVHIAVAKETKLSQLDPRVSPFFSVPDGLGGGQPKTRSGEGSGFIISADGLVLTNHHVVSDADEVTVTLDDDRSFPATVLGSDPRTDVALVQLEGVSDLQAATLGSSEALEVGDWVVAIGNPFGLDHSVSAGIVSGKGRDLGAGPYDAFLQTDASINPGNSGGPLFNLAGEVIGINTAIIGQGIGFAVPIDMVAALLPDLQDHGRVARGWMGVGLRPLNDELAQKLGVNNSKGVVFGEIYAGTPAAEAGLRAGDVLVSLDGTSVDDSASVVRAIGQRRPGEDVKLGVLRDGRKKTIRVTLAERPEEQALRRGEWQPRKQEASAGARKLGVTLESHDKSIGSRGRHTGVRIADVDEDGPAAGRLRSGDEILSVNGTDVSSPREVLAVLQDSTDRVLLIVQRGDAQTLVDVPLRSN